MVWCPETHAGEPRRPRVDRVLRRVLAPLLDQAAGALPFAREAKGRPYLDVPNAPDFNLSDTVGGSVVAVCRQARVGIDLERQDRTVPVARLAARWFSPEEAEALAGLAPEPARQAFLRLWTAKEASCKATGTGIYGYLARWRFDLAADTPQPRHIPDDAGGDWHFFRLAPAPTHTAAIALRGRRPRQLTLAVLADA